MAKCINRTHVPEMLGILGCIGVISTTILAVKATPKAIELLESADKEKDEKLSKWEKVKTVVPVYLPAVISGTVTVVCIAGSTILSKKQQASLVSAYGIIDQSYRNYRNKVIEKCGVDTHNDIIKSIAEEAKPVYINAECFCTNCRQDLEDDFSEPVLFYDIFADRYFEVPLEQLLLAEYHVNRNMALGAVVLLNDFYDFLGISKTDYGDTVGWYVNDDYFWIDFNHRKVTMDDGLECYIVDYVFPPDTSWQEEY